MILKFKKIYNGYYQSNIRLYYKSNKSNTYSTKILSTPKYKNKLKNTHPFYFPKHKKNKIHNLNINKKKQDLVSLSLLSPEDIILLGEKNLRSGHIVGEISNSSMDSIKKPIVHGFFSEQIFGSINAESCACQKLQDIASLHHNWVLETMTSNLGDQKSQDVYIGYMCSFCLIEYNLGRSTLLSRQNERSTIFGHIQTSLPVINPLFFEKFHYFLNWSSQDLRNALFNRSFGYYPILQNFTFFSSQLYYYYLQENSAYFPENNNIYNSIFIEPLLLKKKEKLPEIYQLKMIPFSLFLESWYVSENIISENFINFYGIHSRKYWPLDYFPNSSYFSEFLDLFWISQTQLDKPQIPYLLRERSFFERNLEIDFPEILYNGFLEDVDIADDSEINEENMGTEINILIGTEIAEMILVQDYFFFSNITHLNILYNKVIYQYISFNVNSFFDYIQLFLTNWKNIHIFFEKNINVFDILKSTENFSNEFYYNSSQKLYLMCFLYTFKKMRKVIPLSVRKFKPLYQEKIDSFLFFMYFIKMFNIQKSQKYKGFFKYFAKRSSVILETKMEFLLGEANPLWILLRRFLVLPPEYRPVIDYDNDIESNIINQDETMEEILQKEIPSIFISEVNYLYKDFLFSIDKYLNMYYDEDNSGYLFRPQTSYEEISSYFSHFMDPRSVENFNTLANELVFFYWDVRVASFTNMQRDLGILINHSKPVKLNSQSFGITKPQSNLESLLDRLKGKTGYIRQYLLGRRVDYSGRSVIASCPDLEIYECGIPFNLALILFSPFLKRITKMKAYSQIVLKKKKFQENLRNIQKGSSYQVYIKDLKKRNSLNYPEYNKNYLWEILENFCKMIPVLLNRAPTLHRKGIQGFILKLSRHKAIELHPLVCPAFNADFDGDQMAIHLPITESSRIEALSVLWSSLAILGIADGEPIISPAQDMILGLNYSTLASSKSLIYNSTKNQLIWFNLSDILLNEKIFQCYIQFDDKPRNISWFLENFNDENDESFLNDIEEIHLIQNTFCKKITTNFLISVNSIIFFSEFQKQQVIFKTTLGRFVLNKYFFPYEKNYKKKIYDNSNINKHFEYQLSFFSVRYYKRFFFFHKKYEIDHILLYYYNIWFGKQYMIYAFWTKIETAPKLIQERSKFLFFWKKKSVFSFYIKTLNTYEQLEQLYKNLYKYSYYYEKIKN
uniref:DNA-directed RNA polymerase n=1 Tax=Prototheca stagnorum TaxID=215448 RepID=A0A2Z6BEP1_9CHLO|nr:rna polymerase beta subunit [Prototheca stagnorum]BBD20190.1 rna polymerase beta subunit [Prototheca stagnorum]